MASPFERRIAATAVTTVRNAIGGIDSSEVAIDMAVEIVALLIGEAGAGRRVSSGRSLVHLADARLRQREQVRGKRGAVIVDEFAFPDGRETARG